LFCLQTREMLCQFQVLLLSWQPIDYGTLSWSKPMTTFSGRP
jgi:hypothetical protein